MGRAALIVDNAFIESFWSTMQRELLDHSSWDSRSQLSSATFERIEERYEPARRHITLGNLSSIEFEAITSSLTLPNDQDKETVRETGSDSVPN